ncbi:MULTISPECIES: cardiolipin synthase [unclassified Psychrobacter]|uniref:cardiolipin synthase n=2 Tax=Psychrobacter TaxID=497 RepID=UPI00086C2C79|nr:MULTISPECIES: cardiolipin synthase [unclassified Psychrobacter]OEH68495.1 MAG: cardiolipin synthase [Psychrobacter sp. B29-1]MBA6243922.1 cardiolipin synthase [Psychrobacter sp. Urea-trap-18]MBA6285505.1 cardiolipin synthase [Psychrobacter sp. Urea-trap-16]MBA6318975.1 cardiolipin synthase [Psychrobacter sp. Urea-trap-20]MBA6334994.1 cardiolipin synthase [Psychrobacter sp. Urea-trap-19]|tara:strand:+ start:269 stop:1906 length:1638 start_codon:yes stop_codon:yes gene_type:complete
MEANINTFTIKDTFTSWTWGDLAGLGLVLHIVLMIVMTLRVVSVQRNIGVSIAWVAVLYTLPIFGFVAYILLGEPMIGRRYRERVDQASILMNDMARREHLIFDKGQDLLPANYRGVSQIGTRWTGFGVFPNHQMQLLTDPASIFQRLIEDIHAAQRIVLMEFYIVYPKGQVLEVIEALSVAAQRGVECHILADSVGSFSFINSSVHRKLEKAGVYVHQSLPVGLFKTLFKRSDLRNHRKMVVIDEHIGYIGSFNLVDPRFFKQNKNVGQWIDVALRTTSQQSISINTAMAKVIVTDIGAESNDNLAELHQRVNNYTRKLYVMHPTINDLNSRVKVLTDTIDDHEQPDIGATSIVVPKMPVVDKVLAQLIPSAPQLTAHVIYNTLVTVIHRANKRIRITTPYFVPDESLSGALTIAAKRGVDVTIIVPEKVDSFLVQHASQAYYQELLDAGVVIALFRGGLLHAKTVVIDDDYCLFGTVNIDMRSFYLNMEVSLAIYTPEMVAQVADCQEVYLENCRILDSDEWQQRHGSKRLFDNVVRLFSPLL